MCFLCQQEGKNRGVEMSPNSLSRSVKAIQNIALRKENTLFATEKCVTDNGRPAAKENEPLPGHQDGVNGSMAQKSLFSLLLKLGISKSALENKATWDDFASHTHSTHKIPC